MQVTTPKAMILGQIVVKNFPFPLLRENYYPTSANFDLLSRSPTPFSRSDTPLSRCTTPSSLTSSEYRQEWIHIKPMDWSLIFYEDEFAAGIKAKVLEEFRER